MFENDDGPSLGLSYFMQHHCKPANAQDRNQNIQNQTENRLFNFGMVFGKNRNKLRLKLCKAQV